MWTKVFFFGRWPSSWLTLNITVLESNCSSCGRNVCIFTDNKALVSIINKQMYGDAYVMVLLAKLILTYLAVMLTLQLVMCRVVTIL